MDEPIFTAPGGSAPESPDDRIPGSTLEGALIHADPAFAAQVAAQLGVDDAGDRAT